MSIDFLYGAVDRQFVFLLVLPFLVGLAGLASEYFGQLLASRSVSRRPRAIQDKLLIAISKSQPAL